MARDTPVRIAAFYRFQRLEGLEALRERLFALLQAEEVRGILLIAPEGFNATLSAPPQRLEQALAGLAREFGVAELAPRLSDASQQPFKRLKVRVKKEIVTLGVPGVDPTSRVGRYVSPGDWNALIADPDVLLIDTRNAYEVEFGSFSGALDPETRSFGEFPAWVRTNLEPNRHRKVAMFCTGGIRCEKASSFMLGEGFSEVYHLKGGILAYLEQVPAERSRWSGGCFVFDERVAVGHGLAPLPARQCLSCNAALDEAMLQARGYEEGVSCPRCVDRLTPQQKASARERQRQIDLARRVTSNG